MAAAQVGARFIDGLRSVVVFLTPAHADPAAIAHASATPLIMLVPIIVAPAIAGWLPLVVNRGDTKSFCKRRAVQPCKAELKRAKLFASLVDAAGEEATVDSEQVAGYETCGVGGQENGRARHFVGLS